MKDQPTALPGYSMNDLRKLIPTIIRTGVGRDAIPALSRPQYVNVSDASLSMDDDEVVFLVQYPNGLIRVFPQRILVWHEVINDVLPDATGNVLQRAPLPGAEDPNTAGFTITYSPITGTVTAFRSLAGKYPTTFGVSGDLLNGNSILYDRISGSLWSQLLATCIDGAFRGKRLERYPVLWATWKGVKERYLGKAQVLSRSTGFSRPYGKDPYGSYQLKGSYYTDLRLMYAISRLDKRLPPKKRILGVEIGSLYGAVQVDSVRESQVLNFSLGVTPLAAVYDTQLQAVRIFDRRLDGKNDQMLTFSIFEDKLIDDQTRSHWTAEGVSYYGRLRDHQLIPVLAIDSMWYAWSTFHKDTDVFPFDKWGDQEQQPSPSLPPRDAAPLPPAGSQSFKP